MVSLMFYKNLSGTCCTSMWICTPGMLVAAKSLLEKNANPTETEIRYWLAGNLCRCTGYDKIVKAVQAAAEEIRENA